jgi:hypothetical protein
MQKSDAKSAPLSPTKGAFREGGWYEAAMWTDTLTSEEVVGTLRAAERLKTMNWAAGLLSQIKPILDRLRVGLNDKDAYRANPLVPSEMSFLFEIRFAAAIAAAGLSAEYEHSSGVGNSTVDFRVALDPPWLVELVSLHESDAFKAATWSDGVHQGYILHTDADDPKQSTEGEALKAQERIGAKVFERKRGPIKFPVPDGSAIHMVMVDARGFGGDGHGDAIDWRHIAHGQHGWNAAQVMRWTNTKTGVRMPIRGLFEPECPLEAAQTLQARLHVIGFICERTFAETEIAADTVYLCNPSLFEDEAAANVTMSRWPLRAAEASNKG